MVIGNARGPGAQAAEGRVGCDSLAVERATAAVAAEWEGAAW